jgi:deoxycytidylate deaminase
MAAVAAVKAAPSAGAANAEGPSLAERQTPELIFGMVGSVGSGVSTTAMTLKTLLEEQYGYTVTIHKVSDIIKECGHLCTTSNVPSAAAGRVDALQRMGTELRGKFSEDYLAKKCVEKIAVYRQTQGGYDPVSTDVPLPRRHAHIIDSLKHPAEAKLLRAVYGDIFWLITVFAPEDMRERRLHDLGIEKAEVAAIKERDRDEGVSHGQQVQKCSQLGDFFVRNHHGSKDPLEATIDRYLEMLFDIRVHTPRNDESAMYAAASAASRSACLSRQVGAAIMSAQGELIGVGWNDVPAFGGGLYAEVGNPNDDHRCYRWGNKICHNDDRKSRLYERIASVLAKNEMLASGVDQQKVKALLASTEIRNLIEYSRAVHAEMEAIISVARTQQAGLVGASMYVTTFPCHSCARHIVAAGINRVIFIEPYDKSLAGDLHNDSVSTDDHDQQTKVRFLQYEGVAPRNMIRLFNHGRDRKRGGVAIEARKTEAIPICASPLDGYARMEQIVLLDVTTVEKKQTEVGVGNAG